MFSQYLFSNTSGPSVEIFQDALKIAQQVPVYKIYRPTDGDTVERILEEIEKAVKKM